MKALFFSFLLIISNFCWSQNKPIELSHIISLSYGTGSTELKNTTGNPPSNQFYLNQNLGINYAIETVPSIFRLNIGAEVKKRWIKEN